MKYSILAEVREDYPSLVTGSTIYNDYVSKQSMQDFCSALNKAGFNCSFFGGIKALLNAYQSHADISDTIFINYNYGLPAAYKRVQCPALLELMKAKYSGSDPFVSLLVNDKEYTKKVLRAIDIRTPPSILVSRADNAHKKLQKAKIPLPLVVKPNCEGSSIGITSDCLCSSYDAANIVIRRLLPEYGEIIIEQYIAGYECTVWVIGNPGDFRLLAPLLVSENGNYYFKQKIFTMQDKANRVREHSLPTTILGADMVNEIEQISKAIFTELGLRDYARFDYRISNGNVYFIEANALPIFSQTSEIGKISQLYGITYEKICKDVVDSINTRLMAQTD